MFLFVLKISWNKIQKALKLFNQGKYCEISLIKLKNKQWIKTIFNVMKKFFFNHCIHYYGTQNDEMKHVVCFCTAVIDWDLVFCLQVFFCFISVHISQIHNQLNNWCKMVCNESRLVILIPFSFRWKYLRDNLEDNVNISNAISSNNIERKNQLNLCP